MNRSLAISLLAGLTAGLPEGNPKARNSNGKSILRDDEVNSAHLEIYLKVA
jgi:hypothetical protein